jgi:hypothetical protein
VPELIADLDYRVMDTTGSEYYVSVAAEMDVDGRWEAWLEFAPLDDSDVLVTPTQTHQTTRAAVEHWATTLSQVYVDTAFGRAVSAVTVPRSTHGSRSPAEIAVAPPRDIDPFALIRRGHAALRAALLPLSRAELMAVIENYDLNPARKSLSWLSRAQLVIFIVTAVEAQLLLRER